MRDQKSMKKDKQYFLSFKNIGIGLESLKFLYIVQTSIAVYKTHVPLCKVIDTNFSSKKSKCLCSLLAPGMTLNVYLPGVFQ